MMKDRVAKIQFTHEELAERLGLISGAEVLGVEASYDKVSVVVAHRSLPIKPRSRLRVISGTTLAVLFRTSPPKAPKIDGAMVKNVLRYCLTEHGNLLVRGEMDRFIDRFVQGCQDWEEEEFDDDGI